MELVNNLERGVIMNRARLGIITDILCIADIPLFIIYKIMETKAIFLMLIICLCISAILADANLSHFGED